MSGLLRLDEQHKKCVELWLRGVPREQIAEECGVARSTIYLWMKEPLVLNYYEWCVQQYEAERLTRMIAPLQETLDLYLTAVRKAKSDLTSEDAAKQLLAPSLTAISKILDTIFRLERTDAGSPSSITENRTSGGAAAGKPERSLMEKLLDGIVREGGPVTVEIEATKPQGENS